MPTPPKVIVEEPAFDPEASVETDANLKTAEYHSAPDDLDVQGPTLPSQQGGVPTLLRPHRDHQVVRGGAVRASAPAYYAVPPPAAPSDVVVSRRRR